MALAKPPNEAEVYLQPIVLQSYTALGVMYAALDERIHLVSLIYTFSDFNNLSSTPSRV